MLQNTLQAAYTPGVNLKGEVAGASWMFLLPKLSLERTVCIGVPSRKQLKTMARLSREVVICTDEPQSKTVDPGGISNLHVINITAGVPLPFAQQSVDLLVFASVRDLETHARSLHALGAPDALTLDGVIFLEARGSLHLLHTTLLQARLQRPADTILSFWINALGDEVHAAIPASDGTTIAYFARNGLFKAPRDQSLPGRVGNFVRKRLHTLTHRAGALLPAGFTAAGEKGSPPREPNISRQPAPRFGFFLGRGLTEQPPRYLCELAAAAGADIGAMRWGLVAPGDYASRKVLFFLINRETARLEYIVKMTRDQTLNHRLEAARNALTLLERKGIGTAQTLPRVAFSGTHGGLAILGETAIDGRPFRQATQATADCPYAHAATDWLRKLAAATTTTATAEEAAARLEQLFTRFVELYRLAPSHKEFLAQQIATLRRDPHPFPLVFQHGDPGTWNMLATDRHQVAFLDWEAAEPQGMPLWDLFYFLRSYSIIVARAQGTHNNLKGFAQHFLGNTALNRMIGEAIARYRETIGLSATAIGPLFYTCWMHRALKEATRTAPAKLERGHYVNLLRLCIDKHDQLSLLTLR
ncbi:MAG TPA: aminoglycoside phosphotransferase family protein [Chloroflexaceae bacterium]|nr:aminoglycoside phosphotransferase family protein [Chloroflexaceae bacterium]